ncbi:MAG TPA: rhodanese-like domain-containing protein [Gammaproteobacteria bacterium]
MQIINRRELKRMLERDRGFVLIEALPEDEFQRGHLPFAINVPLDDAHFAERVREAVPEPDRDIIVYCSNAASPLSREAARRIEELGYVSVYEYLDGKEDWFKAEDPTLQ